MIKPFIVLGNRIDGDLLAKMNQHNLKKITVKRRIEHGWTPHKACTTPVYGTVPKRRKDQKYTTEIKPHNPVKVYHLPLDKIWEKYGKPGEIMYPERQLKKEPMKW